MCSYLLAHDFINNHFTFILKATLTDEKVISKTLVVHAGDDNIELELGNPLGFIKSGSNITSILPLEIGELMVTRELNLVTISSKHRGFEIECNLKFDLCSFKLR